MSETNDIVLGSHLDESWMQKARHVVERVA